MAQTVTGIGKTKILNQLDTYNHTALNTAMYFVSVSATEVPPSGLIVEIQLGGVQKAISVVPAAGQNHVDLQVVVNAAASNVISVILSSALAIDTELNNVRATLNMHIGSS